MGDTQYAELRKYTRKSNSLGIQERKNSNCSMDGINYGCDYSNCIVNSNLCYI
ncbi:hypothetical protein JOD26_000484 [Limosilactobacillus caviae]|uniref:Uncharacterized protein n=1 Tax=Limosilactobacillus caviae TaxID=1769424 RepID=A0ABQ2C3I9_9LACO|nr:hypothetical protein GCM10011459_02960 [Limosilactobacillus caviae]